MAFAKGYPRPLLLGMVHLRALPGSPRFDGDLDQVIRAASADLKSLILGGADGAIIENLGDAPDYPDRVPPITIAAMTAVTVELMTLPPSRFMIGINVLRNDAAASLSIAAAAGASLHPRQRPHRRGDHGSGNPGRESVRYDSVA